MVNVVKILFSPILTFLHLFLAIATISSLVTNADAVMAGDVVEWTRHSYLVKVLARNDEGTVQACSGSMISSCLVLTSLECVLNRSTRAKLTEFAVITSNPASIAKRRIYSASLLEIGISRSWALLKISPQNISEICPEKPVPPRIARLNIQPTLLRPSRVDVNFFQPCWVVGFETAPNATDFANQTRTFRLELSKMTDPDQGNDHIRALVMRNYTTCFDDTGLPLFCSTQHGEMQVGIFQSLSFVDENGEGINLTSMDICPKAVEMEFSMLTDDESLVQALQKYDIDEFVATYKACGFISPTQ